MIDVGKQVRGLWGRRKGEVGVILLKSESPNLGGKGGTNRGVEEYIIVLEE